MTRTRRSSKKSPSIKWGLIGIGIGTIGLIAAISFSIYSFFLAAPVGLSAIAKAIPEDAHLVVAFNASWDSWQKLTSRLSPDAVKQLTSLAIQSPLQSLLSQSNTDFGKDIQPWLGSDLVVALIADPQNPDNPPGTLIILPTANPGNAEQFLAKYRNTLQAQGANFSEQNYRGFSFYQSPTRELRKSLITANLDGKLIALSNSRNLIQQVLDTYKGDRPALAEKPSFKQAFSQNDSQSLVKLYLDQAIAQQFLSSQVGSQLSSEDNNKGLEAITLEAKIQDQGLRIALDSHLQNEQLGLNTSQKTISHLPANTFGLISGNNLQQSWQSIRARAKNNPTSDRLVTQWQEAVKQNLNLDWEKDILAWMTGEFAIAAVNNNQGVLQAPGFGLVMLAQTSDPTATAKLLEKWSDLAKSGVIPFVPPGTEIQNSSQSGKPITTWQLNSANSSTKLASQGFLEPDLAFWAMGNIGNSILPKPSKNLANSNTWQSLTADLTKPSGGYFYLDLVMIKAIAAKVIPKELKATDNYSQAIAVTEGIPGMAVSLSSPDPKSLRLDLLVSLKSET